MSGALEGLKVIDLTSYLSGPFCAQILGDQGADVIKVERPDIGDDTRWMPPFVEGESATFMLWNRNKRSVVLDLKSEDGLDACKRLIADADVVIENFKPGVAARLGLGYETLHEAHPRLIYCSVSGFGQTGPYRSRGGFDLIMQGISGLMSVNGEKDGTPLRQPLAISDVGAGLYAAVGILCAMAARERTGEGQLVDVSLLDSVIALGVYEAAGFFATGERPKRLGHAHRGGSPYQMLQTRDGWITFGANSPHLWERFCGVIDSLSLIDDPRFDTNAKRVGNNEVLVELIQEKLVENDSAHWLEKLELAGIPAGPVLYHDETFADPQVLAREMVVDVEHPATGTHKTLGTPVKLSETPGGVFRPAPLFGEHTEEVLAELISNNSDS